MRASFLGIAGLVLAASRPAVTQSFPSADPVLRRIWTLGMDSSQTYRLAQALFDSVGPRLTGTHGMKRGNDWLLAQYAAWGIPARNEQYGTWKGWQRGITHVDLLAPRVRTLEGMMLAWSPGTGARDVTGAAVLLPELPDSSALARWLPEAKGKFVLISMLQPTCRPDADWEQFALKESLDRLKDERNQTQLAWNRRVANTGYSVGLGTGTLGRRLEQAGVAGVIVSRWSNGWGVQKVFGSLYQEKVPAIDLSCEDYGLVYRLAEHGQGPLLRVRADAQFLGDVPVFNTIAELRGREKPNEYIVLSAHFDSWDGGSGTTDNGTGTMTMLEAMRILRSVYPDPKRTIIAGHWSGEEQGLNGSRAWAQDHPEVVNGLQALFNQDNGTGRVVNLSAAGLTAASGNLAQWIARIPADLTRHITLGFPGAPSGGGSDNASFICYGAPAFGLGALGWNYGTYTWHTQRDTFDKIVWDDLRNNATLTAMLAYLASEDQQTVPRERRAFERGSRTPVAGPGGFGEPTAWPTCTAPQRDAGRYAR
ncbi:MAG: M20/M25/M40 family metallo-hydrolase [Gemmatimonadaceae bacterium]